MPKQRKTIPHTVGLKGKLRLGRRPLLLLLAATALAFGLTQWGSQPKHPRYRTLPQIVAAYDGFAQAEAPDRPGPYEDLGACRAESGEPVTGSFWANGKSCRFHIPAVPGEELRAWSVFSLRMAAGQRMWS